MTHGSLFSGIGGFDLAAEWMGWENIFHCEWNTFGQRVLKHHFPNSISYEDITKTDFSIHRGTIDILTGGFPCQPYSLAGKRKGKDDERHLWPEMLRAIREIQPRYVVGENVSGIINWSGGLVFNEVQTDLEAEGYEVFAYVLPACAVNAPHRRDRVWFIAANTKNIGSPISKLGKSETKQQIQTRSDINGFESLGDVTDTNCSERKKWSNINGEWENEAENKAGVDNRLTRLSEYKYAPNSSNPRLQGSEVVGSIGSRRADGDQQPAGCVPPNWDQFPTQSPICGRDDGLPTELDGITFPKWRAESIKAYGNAIVPQVALQIFKAIEKYNITFTS